MVFALIYMIFTLIHRILPGIHADLNRTSADFLRTRRILPESGNKSTAKANRVRKGRMKKNRK